MNASAPQEINNENNFRPELGVSADSGDNLNAYRLDFSNQRMAQAENQLPSWFPSLTADTRSGAAINTAQVTDRLPGSDQVTGRTFANGIETGVLHRDQVINSEGRERRYHYYVPRSYDASRPIPLVVALDGIQIGSNNALNGMAYSNRMIEQAERYGFALLIPEHLPQPVLGGLKTGFGWNEPNGAVNFTQPHGWSDSRYIRSAMDTMFARTNIDRQQVFAVGFSQGGLAVHELVARNPGLFNAVASVHGTVLDRVGQTPAGTRFLAIHGEGDTSLPYRGGLGWANWVMATRNYSNTDSRPHAQIGRYLNANRVTNAEERSQTEELRIRSWRRGAEEQPFVQEVYLRNARWGHAWHGRGGEPTFNGTPAPASVFDTNQHIFERFFRLQRRSS